MGLAESTGGDSWLVRRDCEQVLRAIHSQIAMCDGIDKRSSRWATLPDLWTRSRGDGLCLAFGQAEAPQLDRRHEINSCRGAVLVFWAEAERFREFPQSSVEVNAARSARLFQLRQPCHRKCYRFPVARRTVACRCWETNCFLFARRDRVSPWPVWKCACAPRNRRRHCGRHAR